MADRLDGQKMGSIAARVHASPSPGLDEASTVSNDEEYEDVRGERELNLADSLEASPTADNDNLRAREFGQDADLTGRENALSDSSLVSDVSGSKRSQVNPDAFSPSSATSSALEPDSPSVSPTSESQGKSPTTDIKELSAIERLKQQGLEKGRRLVFADWYKVRNEGAVEVYRMRNVTKEPGETSPVMLVGVVAFPIQPSTLALIMESSDVKQILEPRVRVRRIVEQVDPFVLFFYEEVTLPWPFAVRWSLYLSVCAPLSREEPHKSESKQGEGGTEPPLMLVKVDAYNHPAESQLKVEENAVRCTGVTAIRLDALPDRSGVRLHVYTRLNMGNNSVAIPDWLSDRFVNDSCLMFAKLTKYLRSQQGAQTLAMVNKLRGNAQPGDPSPPAATAAAAQKTT